MIFNIDGPSQNNIDAAAEQLRELARTWGLPFASAPAAEEPATPDLADKSFDPIAVTSVVLALPSAALAAVDIADRIRKRRRAQTFIDSANLLAAQQVTVHILARTVRYEVSSLDADQLLDLAESEPNEGEERLT